MKKWKTSLGAAALSAVLVCAAAAHGKRKRARRRNSLPPLGADSLRRLSPNRPNRIGEFVEERLFSLEPEIRDSWSRNDWQSARLLLSSLIGLIAAQGETNEKDFPHLLRMLDYCDPNFRFEHKDMDAIVSVMQDSAEGRPSSPAWYLADYLRFHVVCERKQYVIACCRVLLYGLLAALRLHYPPDGAGGEEDAIA